VAYYNRGRLHDNEGRSEPALADYNQLLKLQPQHSTTLNLRGTLHLRLGHINQALADFDDYLKLMPAQEPYHWLRGIALYYAGRYEDGRRQFEKYHSVKSDDAETPLWHFLCVARLSGPKKARASLLSVGKDRRVPMMQLYSFFAGTAKPDEVIEAAKAGNPAQAELNRRLVDANYYIGLYYEATGDEPLGREHIAKAAEEGTPANLTCALARVHTALRSKSALQQPKP
jgi:lipoprotein NlpI